MCCKSKDNLQVSINLLTDPAFLCSKCILIPHGENQKICPKFFLKYQNLQFWERLNPEILKTNLLDKDFQKKHNKGLDMLQDYKTYLEKQVQNLKRLDEQSEFMKKWNETTIKEKTEEIVIIDKILKSLIRFQCLWFFWVYQLSTDYLYE